MATDAPPDPLNLLELEPLAKARLAPMAYDYYASGSDDEVTLRANRAAFERLRLHYRVLVDVGRRSLATSVLGERIALPVLVAPTAFHRLACDEGERATARAAGGAGTVMIVSTLSTTSIEDIAAVAPGPLWFQLYVYKDRGATRGLVERVAAAGAKALVLTVDAPFLGRRERDVRNRFRLPDGLHVQNLVPAGLGDLPTGLADSGLAAYFASLLDAAVTWADLEWLRSVSPLPVLVKGVVRGDDAARALGCGASGIVVSNHGGRQLDGSPATIEVLEEVVAATAGKGEVLLDGGIRRGTDVLKALALGARAVLIGRPILWGLGWAGEAGARRVLDMLRTELDLALALAGVADVTAVPRDLVRWAP